ncbi:MAG: sulfite exporter TauE/SafE family protein, partial [Enterobacterales bacterium]|nr:sulfite exporter TauE/SafE family protein [Enterobacterales bacterium]
MTEKIHHQGRLVFFLLSSLILLSILFYQPYENLLKPLELYGHFFLIGIFAATVANSTGAGGGIVFIPAFIALGLTPLQSLATSFAIQCFGMSSGALAWLSYRRIELVNHAPQWHDFGQILLLSAIPSVVGILITQQLMPDAPVDVELLFSIFSLVVGIFILIRTLKLDHESPGRTAALSVIEKVTIVFACLVGGVLTTWISIAVGEILAILLILLRFRVNLAIACAVIVTAMSVLAAIPYHIFVTEAIYLNVLLLAAAGALIGGALARR